MVTLSPGLERVIVTGDGAVIHADAAEFEALLDAGAFHVRPIFEKKGQERGGFGDGALGRHGTFMPREELAG
jgi:hypothetical protein